MREIFSARNKAMLERRGHLLAGYLPLGYPDAEGFLQLLPGMASAGADVLEIGYPSADPSADGAVVRAAMERIDPTLAYDSAYWRRVRAATDAPLWVMGYGCDLLDTGAYLALAKSGAPDALVIPDITTGRTIELSAELAPLGVDVVCFTRPSMVEAQYTRCYEEMAIIYQQLHDGSTGTSDPAVDYRPLLRAAKDYPHVRVFAGFGIDSPEAVKALIDGGFDGAIIGSELLRRLQVSEGELYGFLEGCKAAIR